MTPTSPRLRELQGETHGVEPTRARRNSRTYSFDRKLHAEAIRDLQDVLKAVYVSQERVGKLWCVTMEAPKVLETKAN